MDDPAVRRALADDHRVRIVAELRGAPDGLDVRELGRRLGLHENTIRWHLGILDGAGLVEASPAASGAPGRPRMIYRARPEARAVPGGDEHRLLAAILTGTLASMDGGRERAVEAGRAWGRYLVHRPSPLERVHDTEAVAEVARILDDEGFAAEPLGADIHMHRCPFKDLAETSPEIVCGAHLGLMAGALDELGSDLEPTGLEAFVEPGLCIAHLGPRRS